MATPKEQTEALLEMISSGEMSLVEAHEIAWGGLRTNVSLADCLTHIPNVVGDYARDAVALTGLSPSVKFKTAGRAQVELAETLLKSGLLYPPWQSFPWWAEPDEPW